MWEGICQLQSIYELKVNENIKLENESTNLTAYWLSMAASSSPSSSFKIAWIRDQERKDGGCRTTHWISERKAFQQFHIFRHSSTHQERLVHFRKISTAENLTNIFIVSVREYKIGFVDHERLEQGQRQDFGLQNGERSWWCRYYNVRFVRKQHTKKSSRSWII